MGWAREVCDREIGIHARRFRGLNVTDFTDAAVVSALRRQMTVAAAKQVVASGNLANVNTPGFKAKEFEFSDALSKQLAGGPGLAVTSSKHMSGARRSEPRAHKRSGRPAGTPRWQHRADRSRAAVDERRGR